MQAVAMRGEGQFGITGFGGHSHTADWKHGSTGLRASSPFKVTHFAMGTAFAVDSMSGISQQYGASGINLSHQQEEL